MGDLPTLGKPIIPAFNPIIKITEISFIITSQYSIANNEKHFEVAEIEI